MVGRMTKRILAIGAALLLCLFCVCAWAEGENCRLTLTLAFGEQPVEGAEFSLYRVGEMQMSGGAAGFVPLAAYANGGCVESAIRRTAGGHGGFECAERARPNGKRRRREL